ncbi:GNAT family N-acetyltransferase [Pediococcus siamensis]|uniref:GNAT family N-acetyltransferase n=1 Tax=Pediococcus siamensis TaxID=381829 RepID=UPI0039A3D85E
MEFTNDGNQITFTYHEKVGGRAAYFLIRNGQTLVIEQIFVNPELRGQGLAQRLLLACINYAKANQKQIYPLCPYAQSYFKQHPEYQDLIDTTPPSQEETEQKNGSK